MMKRPIFIFTFFYFLLTLLIAAALYLLGADKGGGLNIIAVMGASFFAANQFVKTQKRNPTGKEKNRYSFLALISTWIVSSVLVCIVLWYFSLIGDTVEMLSNRTFLLFGLLAFFFLSACYFFTIRWAFSWYARKAASAYSA